MHYLYIDNFSAFYTIAYVGLSQIDGLVVLLILNGLISGSSTLYFDAKLALSDLIPVYWLNPMRRFFRYEGSLTTPDCNEAITWNVFQDPIYISQDQVLHCQPKFTHMAKVTRNLRFTWLFFSRFRSFPIVGILTVIDSIGLNRNAFQFQYDKFLLTNFGSGAQMVNNYRYVQSLNDRIVYRSSQASIETKSTGWSYAG